MAPLEPLHDQRHAAVVEDVTRRSGAELFATLGTFPDKPDDIEQELTAFATRLVGRCMCDDDGRALRKLIEAEGQRYPELFETWRDYGPGKSWPALSARFGKLAHDGYLDLDDANLAARQFMALVNADLPNTYHLGAPLTEAEIEAAIAANGWVARRLEPSLVAGEDQDTEAQQSSHAAALAEVPRCARRRRPTPPAAQQPLAP